MEPAQPNFTANYLPEEPKVSPDLVKKLIILAGIVLVMIFWTFLSSPMLVSVTGTGNVSVTATNSTIDFSVTSSDPAVQGAISGVQTRADAIKQLLIGRGIVAENISSSQVTVVPASLITTGATGFQASITMEVKMPGVTGINDLISTLYSNGVYVVSQPVLSVYNNKDLEVQAMNLAIDDANSQIGKIALKNWKFIRKIVSVSESSTTSSATSTSGTTTASTQTNTSEAQNGVFNVTKVVTVIYKLW